MREILYRGKRVDDGEWVEGIGILDFAQKGHVYIAKPNKPKTAIMWTDVIPETVGQYTGLADINRKKIFDGDIVRTCEDKHSRIFVIKSKCGILGYQYYLEKIDGSEYKAYMPYAMNIIGNIHDNPELLEVSECIGKKS